MTSELEETLLFQIRSLGLPEPVREYRFWPGRKFAFDFIFPGYMLAVEVEGGTYRGGRHTSYEGFERDCIKYNQAALMGWRVLRFTAAMVTDGRAVAVIENALGRMPATPAARASDSQRP